MTRMRRAKVRPSLLALLVFVMPALMMVTPSASQGASSQPNFVFILTDDQPTDTVRFMPNLNDLLIRQGTTFGRYYDNVALCCPARVTLLRGQYSQNTGINRNDDGFARFHDGGLEDSTVATWLQGVGYRTVLIGKYLNTYPRAESAPENFVPPGWSEWYGRSSFAYNDSFDYTLNENGTLVKYGSQPEDYMTDVIARKSDDFIRRASSAKRPFFMYLAPAAPHTPATPAPRHAKLFPDLQAPRPPSFNEADVSDKPMWVREQDLLTSQQIGHIDQVYRRIVQALQAVDELVGTVVDTLRDTGQLDNTYIMFSSDNGMKAGEHRLNVGKNTAYEEDIRVPFIVRGPGVAAGRVVSKIAGNIDFAPTLADLASAAIPSFVDGRSLAPLLSGPSTGVSWRDAYLVRRVSESHPSITGIRRNDHVYLELTTGEREY